MSKVDALVKGNRGVADFVVSGMENMAKDLYYINKLHVTSANEL